MPIRKEEAELHVGSEIEESHFAEGSLPVIGIGLFLVSEARGEGGVDVQDSPSALTESMRSSRGSSSPAWLTYSIVELFPFSWLVNE